MKKPANYENVQVGEYVPPQVGGHIAVVKAVQERKNKNGGDMIVIAFDFAKGDAQEGYFAQSFENDVRPEKKWPFAGTQYVNVYDKDGNCSRNFKSFCIAVEESNKGFTVDWDAKDFGGQFKGKAIGAVFGIVEDEYNGERKKRAQLRWFRKVSGVLEAKVPEPRLLKDSAPAFAPVDDVEVPF